MTNLYQQDGVDIEIGDEFSRYVNQLMVKTYGNSPYVKISDLSRGNFRGPRGYTLVGLPDGCLTTGAADGIGTKSVIIDAAGNYETAAGNLIAMTAMDITRYGGLPLVFFNILDAKTLGEKNSSTLNAFKKMMVGLASIANEQGYVVLNGETAELGACVGSENAQALTQFNWGGVMLGAYHPNKMILGNTLAPGQIIIALKDNFRSNGISSARKALAIKYGSEWWNNPEAKDDIVQAGAPAKLYDKFLNYLHGWHNPENNFSPIIQMHLIVHLSGGAFESKLGRDMLKPLNLSADLFNLFEPSVIMKSCALWRGMSPTECYKTWNGGQGAIVAVDENNANQFIKIAGEYGIDAQAAGVITVKKEYTVAIKSQFGDGGMIYY
jgi:phosphoribosylaminoimidazole (AIR) synthetase